MSRIWIDILGWSGSAMVVFAYIMNIAGKMSAQGLTYRWLNIVGSVFLIVNTYYIGAYPSAVVNVIWVLVAVGALVRSSLKKEK